MTSVSFPEQPWLRVESLDLEAQGVAHRSDGKVVFIEGALIGEEVRVNVHRKKNNWEQGAMTELRRESAQRVVAGCRYFGLCGGCKVQHLHPAAQLAVKQRVVEDSLWHLAKVKAEQVARPLQGPSWGYRSRARLSVRYVAKKGKVLIGFHERKSSYVADMSSCEVLPRFVSDMLVPLQKLIEQMDQRDRIPQIELAVGSSVTALVLRHLEPLSQADEGRLREFAKDHAVQWWLQPKGPDTVTLLDEGSELNYELRSFGITMPFRPTDFTQVNQEINQSLVARAIQWMALTASDRVIDWFCGLGNFTLPLATQAQHVLGIEGSQSLVDRAIANAASNGLAAQTSFSARNLFDITADQLAQLGTVDKWLVDPPREGAFALAKAVAEVHAEREKFSAYALPKRIVYVSCNPATLARDAGLLVHQGGYVCRLIAAINMFPHTAHVESMALFERLDEPQ